MKFHIPALAVTFCLMFTGNLSAGKPTVRKVDNLTAHEWGTFTVLQNEQGDALPGVNINEESLPPFVYRLEPNLTPDSHELGPLLGLGTHARFASKGIPRAFPAAYMRMETPVIYFYPPRSVTEPLKLDVRVDFHRGWISEWYPRAAVEAPGFQTADRKKPIAIPHDGVGSIVWKDVTIGAKGAPTKTDSEVWLAPRDVKSATVGVSVDAADSQQIEKYLFYRGVADLRAPLRVVRSDDGKSVSICPNERDLATRRPFPIDALWLADIRADGMIAFRELDPVVADVDRKNTLARTSAVFDAKDYVSLDQSKLRPSMRRAIIKDGLFDDEADALLNTWEVSYFQSPGLRLFFLLPREWTETALPLTLSKPGADIERVMIGRIEIITPGQRALVRKIAQTETVSTLKWLRESVLEFAC